MGIVADAQIEVRWPAQQAVPLGGWYDVYRDDGAGGGIDYESPVNPRAIDAWPDASGKMGDGLGPDGECPDGFGTGGAGDGMGMDGVGLDGFGAMTIAFVTPAVADGVYDLAVVGFDPAGNPVSAGPASATAGATIAGTPAAPGDLAADGYDDVDDVLTLTWSLSSDDEAA